MGYVLKYEVSVIDKLQPHADLGRGRSENAYTSRVRPAPNPPTRHLVQLLPPVSQSVANGRFTVLTYNLLADLYAKVRLGALHLQAAATSITACIDGVTVPPLCDRRTSPTTAQPGPCTGTTASATCCGSCCRTSLTSCACKRSRATTTLTSGSRSCRKLGMWPSTKRRPLRSTPTTSMPLMAVRRSSGVSASPWSRSMRCGP